MFDPTVTRPEDLAFHVSGYAARLADTLEGGLPGSHGRTAASYPAQELGAAIKNLAQGLEYIRLSAVVTAAVPTVQEGDREELESLAGDLNTLMRRLDAVGTRIATT